MGHEPRLDEDRVLGRLAAVEGAVGPLQLGELAREKRQRLLREARADLAGVDQALALVVADRERPHSPPAAPLARAVATDHDVLGANVLHLQPGATAPAALVLAVEPLGDDALHTELPGCIEQRLAVAPVVGGGAPPGSLELELLEEPAALF